mgnify:CR=1 FL=1
MKVKELRKGMLLVPAGDNEYFSRWNSLGDDIGVQMLHVRTKPKWGSMTQAHWKRDILASLSSSNIAMYLGTKKDLGIDVMWCDRFVLLDGKIAGIDPSAWRRIKEAT